MAKKYGLPYQGSKSKLAERIVALLPPATHLYDVFAGGCAVTHAALLSGKFKEVHANDITDSVKLFADALNGDIAKYEPERFRNKEDFIAEKDSNPYVRIVWSFGNNQRRYLYSRKIEPYKKAVHEMLYAATLNERRLKFKTVIREMEKLGLISNNMPKYMSDRVDMQQGCIQGGGETKDWLGQYERLQSTERAEQIKAIRLTDFEHNERTAKIAVLGSTQLSENRGGNPMSAKLTTKVGDYRDVEILPDSVIYADIPYKSTCGYGIEFDHEAFYDWCEKQTALVLISEYWMPEDRFVCIAEFERKSTFSPTNNTLSRIEKVFVPKGQLEMYKRNFYMMPRKEDEK